MLGIMPTTTQPTLAELFAYNSDRLVDYQYRANCYAFAVGLTPEEIARHDLVYGTAPGFFSAKFRIADLKGYMNRAALFRYKLLADGLVPVDGPDCAPGAGHLIACHLGFNWHFWRKAEGQWIHKNGNSPISDAFGSQQPITDIDRALHDLGGDTPDQGYFIVPADRLPVWSSCPPRYAPATVAALHEILGGIVQGRPHMRPQIMAECTALNIPAPC